MAKGKAAMLDHEAKAVFEDGSIVSNMEGVWVLRTMEYQISYQLLISGEGGLAKNYNHDTHGSLLQYRLIF